MRQETRKTLKKVLSASIIPMALLLPVDKTHAQTINPNELNTLHLTIQPENLRAGFRNDYRIPSGRKKDFSPSKLGLYTSISSGDYNFKDNKYVKENIKAGAGIIIYPEKEPLKDFYEFLSLGFNYNYYNKKEYVEKTDLTRKFKPYSIEVGVGARMNNLSFFVSLDTKLEYTLGIGLVYDYLGRKEAQKNKKLLAKAYSKNTD